jgi:hypothetical protein
MSVIAETGTGTGIQLIFGIPDAFVGFGHFSDTPVRFNRNLQSM